VKTKSFKEQGEREKFVINARYIGDLWKAGNIQTGKIHTILKLLHDCDEFWMKRLYRLLENTGEHLEDDNEVLSHHFNAREEISETAKYILTTEKMEL
jgi:phosphoribosyl-AMP cyclohydrolase